MSQALDQKKKAAGKSAVWYTIAAFTTKGLGFITIPIFTRVMTTGEFGLFNNYAAWQTILLSIVSLESYATLNRARLDYKGKALQDYQFTLLTSSLSITMLLVVLLVCVPTIPELFTDLDREYLYIMVLYLLFYPAFTMFQMLQRVQYRYKLSAGLSLGSSLFATVLAVFLVISLDDALIGRIIGQYVPFVVLGIIFYLWYWKTGGVFKVQYLKYALPLAIPLVVATFGSQVLLLGCRIVTQHSCGPDEVAFLSLATTVAQIALILINTLNNAWAPWLYDCLSENEPKRAVRTFKLYIWGISALVIIVMLAGPELIRILGGSGYISTIWLIPSFMFTCLLSMLVNQYVYLETYYKDVRVGGFATLLFAVLNLPLCWLFIEFWGFEAVGYANIVSNALLVLTHKIILSKQIKAADLFTFDIVSAPIILSAAMIPVALLLYFYDLNIVRWLFIVLVAIAAIVLARKKGVQLPRRKRME